MANNWTVSVLFKWISKAAAPMKSDAAGVAKLGQVAKASTLPVQKLATDVAKAGQAAKASTAPIKDMGQAVASTVQPTNDAAQATQNLGDKAQGTSSKLQTLIKTKLPGWMSNVARAGIVAGGALLTFYTVTAGLVVAGANFVHTQTQAAEAITKAASAAGITTRAYQRLQYTFDGANLQGGALDNVLGHINRTLIEARAGVKSAERPFKALGISIRDASGHTKAADLVLSEAADKFAKIKDGARKAALAQMLFGEAGADLIPLLNGGAKGLRETGDEAERLGAVLDNKTLAAAKALNDKWDALKNSTIGLKNSIWIGLMPSVSKLIDRFQQLLDQNRGEILKGITSGLDWVTKHMPQILKGMGDFVNFLKTIISIGGGVLKVLGGVGGAFDALAVIMIGRVGFAIGSAIVQIWGLNAALYGCPVVWIIAGITAIAVAAYLIIRHWGAVKKFFAGLWSWMKTNWQVIPIVGPMIHAVDLILSNWDKITKWFAEEPKKWWNSLPAWLRGLIQGAWNLSIPGMVVNGVSSLLKGASNQAVTSAPAQSLAAQGVSPAQKISGSIGLTVQSQVPVRVDRMDFSPGVDGYLDRGSLLGAH